VRFAAERKFFNAIVRRVMVTLACPVRRRTLANVTHDDAFDFRPRLGRVRDGGARADGRSRSFLSQAMRAAAKAKGGPPTLGEMRGERPRRSARKRPRKGKCSRIGRGQAAADRLKLAGGRREPSARMRRVVVKARIVRLKLGSRAADAHVRYLQRDGTTRDGERGQLYSAAIEEVDGKAFVERGREDRHQFRFIVAPEDAAQLSDLRTFTRDVMRQMEKDLGTQLDWVAVDHFNTGHPHSHVIVRGRDDLGKDLIIAQDYITEGMRLRAQELVTLELGPETNQELRRKLQAEISAESFTRIDRAMLAEAQERTLDLRSEAGQVRSDFDHTLRIARLQTLERYGLAEQAEPGVWTLSHALEPTMRALGERGDIIKAINRALADRGQQRGPDAIDLHGNELDRPIVGRLIDKRLGDELGDRFNVVIDGIDGRIHHVALPGSVDADEAQVGAIVELGTARSGRPADRNIAGIARQRGGEYHASLHRSLVEDGSIRVPGGDSNAFVGAHVRRLEALRRAGIVARVGADSWLIPDDFEARGAAYDAERESRTRMRLLCAFDLDRQVSSDGATWLDRQLVSRNPSIVATSGFGAEAHQALERRTDELIRQGHASRTAKGQLRVKADLIGSLARQEVERVGRQRATERGRVFQLVREQQTVSGKLLGSAQLVSGRFAMIDDGVNFSLVPWRPVLEKNIGRQVEGIMRGGDVSWQLGKAIGLGL
jgi:type IV secretory pathway VirD2 relaxase